MPASVMTMPEAKKAAQMHAEGYSQPQIAKALGRSRSAVRTAFRQLDIQTRNPAEGYRAWLRLRGGKGPHNGGSGAFGQRPPISIPRPPEYMERASD